MITNRVYWRWLRRYWKQFALQLLIMIVLTFGLAVGMAGIWGLKNLGLVP